MKILHIITRLIVGGAQENTLLTCEGLHSRGHDVTLLTGPSPGPEGSLVDRAKGAGYKVILTPHLVRSPHPAHDLAAYRFIQKLVRDSTPDIVHTHSSKAGILGRAAAWKAGGKRGHPQVVHTIHGLPFHPYQNVLARRLWIALEKSAAKRCHAIITVADAMTAQARAAGIARTRPADFFTTIYSGMEVAPFTRPGVTRDEIRSKLRIPPTAFVYGTIARLQPLKGHDDILAKFAEVLRKVPNAHLLWIGDGLFRQRFELLLKERGWSERATLTGLVPPAEVPRLLPAMDALVHPSYREGLARALPQALLAGIPVITYNCDGAAEVCIPGKTGLLVTTGDSRALADAMIEIAADPFRARHMGETGKALYLERFDARTMTDQIEALYKKLVGAGWIDPAPPPTLPA